QQRDTRSGLLRQRHGLLLRGSMAIPVPRIVSSRWKALSRADPLSSRLPTFPRAGLVPWSGVTGHRIVRRGEPPRGAPLRVATPAVDPRLIAAERATCGRRKFNPGNG